MAEEPTLIREGRKRPKYPLHWFTIPAVVLGGAIWIWISVSSKKNSGPFVVPGYITSTTEFEQQVVHYYGKNAARAEAEEKFQLASAAMSKRDFGGAAALLEETSKLMAIPVVFNNLGVLYWKLDDPTRSVNSFREALARDESYRPSRENLERLKKMPGANAAFPVIAELEPNETIPYANLISLGKAVDGEIDGSRNDVDWYRLTVPVPPRDLIQIDVTNKAPELSMMLSLANENSVALGSPIKSDAAGESIHSVASLHPNSTMYLKVEGLGRASGAYTLLAHALKAFDAFEPNDEIFSATRITPGQSVEANIMDGKDTDYYSFVSPRTGKVSIDIHNRSTTLVPGITTFTSDNRTNDFGPDAAGPGAPLHHSLAVEEGQAYVIQIWSKADTAGAYTLIVQ